MCLVGNVLVVRCVGRLCRDSGLGFIEQQRHLIKGEALAARAEVLVAGKLDLFKQLVDEQRLLFIVLLLELAMVFGVWEVSEGAEAARAAVAPDATQVHNTAALGQLIYDQYIYLFQAAGLILLVAMIGAIVLTLRHRTGVKRQNVMAQMHRDPAKSLEMIDVKPGQGL